jgi:hypothetical protein
MGADQVAAIRPALVEIEDALRLNESECFARFQVPGRDVVWVEAALGTVNLSYPFPDPPDERLRRAGVVNLPGLVLDEWQPELFATFAYDSTTTSREVAKFIDQIMGVVLGCGDDYPIDVEIARVAHGSGRLRDFR